MRTLFIAGLAALTLAGAALPASAQADASVAAALADPRRPEADRAVDAARKPAEILAFAEVKPGQTVADFIVGGGYFTRLLAAAVGPTGRVHAYQPSEFVAYQASYGDQLRAVDAAYDNVVGGIAPLKDVRSPEPLDLVLTVQNYHDLHLRHFATDTAETVNRAIFDGLKPGGVYMIVDHSAAAGSGLRDAHTLHRIDPATVRAEVEAAGFVYEGELNALRNPADTLTVSAFDGSIRGKTDQFVLKFRKPR